jgi:hypothetical protein
LPRTGPFCLPLRLGALKIEQKGAIVPVPHGQTEIAVPLLPSVARSLLWVQFPSVPEPLAAHDLIGINSSERQACLKILPASMHHLLEMALRHEVARLIVWHVVSTRPVVPSAVSYADVREGNDLYRACGHGTHSHPTGTRTVRERCICQHQAETGLDGWHGEPR